MCRITQGEHTRRPSFLPCVCQHSWSLSPKDMPYVDSTAMCARPRCAGHTLSPALAGRAGRPQHRWEAGQVARTGLVSAVGFRGVYPQFR